MGFGYIFFTLKQSLTMNFSTPTSYIFTPSRTFGQEAVTFPEGSPRLPEYPPFFSDIHCPTIASISDPTSLSAEDPGLLTDSSSSISSFNVHGAPLNILEVATEVNNAPQLSPTPLADQAFVLVFVCYCYGQLIYDFIVRCFK